MASKITHTDAGRQDQQNMLPEFLRRVNVVISDSRLNCLHICNDEGSNSSITISEDVDLRGRRMHYNHTFFVVGLSDGREGGKGGYFVVGVKEFPKKKGIFVKLSFDVFAIFITNANQVVLGSSHGHVCLHQLDESGNKTKLWRKQIHTDWIRDLKVHNDKIFTASYDKTCSVLALADGSVLHMFETVSCLHCVCVIDETTILTGSEDGKVLLHSMSTRATSVFVHLGSNPIYALGQLSCQNNDIIYCGGGDQILYAVDVNTKEILWQTKCENGIRSMWVQDGIVSVGVDYSHVICVDGKTGAVILKLSIKPRCWPWSIAALPRTGQEL